MIPIKDDIPSSTFPYVNVAVIILNVIVFAYQLSLGYQGAERFIYRTAAIPYEVTHLVDTFPLSVLPPPFTMLTAMFVHGGFLHLAGNMLFLWIFGDNVEDTLGHFKYLLFYVIAGVIASMAHIVLDPDSTIPMVGASGAVAGVLGAYFLLFPRAQVNTLVFLFFFVTMARVPAIFFLGFWFLMQILSSAYGGGVAWFAHIGGFVAGAATVVIFGLRKKRR